MNVKDLEYLREMANKSGTEDFSDEQLKRVREALSTNVNADDTTEALDLTAKMIYEQSQSNDKFGRKRKVDVEKLDGLAKEIMDKGLFLGAENAIDYAKDVRFAVAKIQAEKGTIAKDDVNLMDSNYNHSILDSMLYEAKSPLAVKALIDKGANQLGAETDFDEIKDMLMGRVISGFDGKDSIKNNLGNLAVLIKTGLIDKPKDLDRLLKNPILFEKYPDMMSKLFEDDKDLPNKLENVKNREKLKEQKDDYLEERFTAVENAVKEKALFAIGRIKPTHRKQRKDFEKVGNTGDSIVKENNELYKNHYQEVADVQKEEAKKHVPEHIVEKWRQKKLLDK